MYGPGLVTKRWSQLPFTGLGDRIGCQEKRACECEECHESSARGAGEAATRAKAVHPKPKQIAEAHEVGSRVQ
jgi:hypothetical protein